MARYKFILLFIFLLAVLRTGVAQSFTIQFNFRFGASAYSSNVIYTTASGEKITINRFKFYVSGLKAIAANGDTVRLSTEHFLITTTDSSSTILTFNSSYPSIQKIIFTIGVDSIRNVSGIQTGSLDPALGMFWTWRTGYIMAKMEGISEQANTAGKRFTHDVGGFQYPYNAVRSIELTIPSHAHVLTGIVVDADLSKWFNGKYSVLLSENPICHTPGKLAMQLADNYSTLFSIASTF